MKRGTRKGAVEMSMGTIVVIVLAVSMLILGMIFVRSIMCSGIVMSEEISENVQNEIRGLFGANEFGVSCMGEGGEEVKIADGGRRKIICVIKTDEGGEYTIRVKEIKSLKGTPTADVNKWVLVNEWKGSVGVGEKTVDPLILNIPKNTQATTLRIIFEESGPGGVKTHASTIDVAHMGAFTAAIC